MKRKNYLLVKKFTKEERSYIKETVRSAKIEYLKKNTKFFEKESCELQREHC